MTTWHAPPDALARYAHAPSDLDEVTASSIEQHLMACDDCRALLSAATSTLELASSWAAVVDVIDRPRTTPVEALLTRLGMSSGLARVVGATPGLRLAWLATIAVLAIGAVALGRENGSDTPFLVLAPLLPLGSVLLTFLPAEEPAGEAAAATPLFGAGVVIRRAVTVLLPTFAILAVSSIALPHLSDAARWLLPGIALAVASLTLSTYVRPVVAIATLSAGWLTLLVAVQVLDGRSAPLASTAVFDARGQLLTLVLSLLAASLLYVRRDRFSTVEVTW